MHRPAPLIERAGLLYLVDGRTLCGVVLVAIVDGLARLGELAPQLVGRIGIRFRLGRRRGRLAGALASQITPQCGDADRAEDSGQQLPHALMLL